MRLRTKYNPRYPSAPGLVLDARMIEGSGSVVHDLSGNGNDGTITDATWTSGEHGPCLSFDGVSAYVDCGSQFELSPVATIEILMSIRTWSNYKSIFGKVATSSDRINIEMWPDSTLRGYIRTGNVAQVSIATNTVSTDTLYHITFTFDEDAQEAKIYQDGSFCNSDTTFTLPNVSGYDFIIGALTSSINYVDCVVDMLRVYNRVLSASEIKRRYEQTKRDYIRG